MPSAQKTWLVTGASSGLGLEIGLAALRRGDKVVGTARNVKKAENDNQDFANLGGHWLELDVTSPKCQEIVAKAVKEFDVDALVNNAGYAEGGTLEDSSMETIRSQFSTNVFGALAVLKGVIPHFRTHARGTILNISSTAAIAPHCYFTSYAATKFALEGISESLSEELSPFDIRVLIIEPGAFRTKFFGALRYTPISEAYKGTVVEETVRAFEGLEGKQEGDPVKAGGVVVEVVHGFGRGEGVRGNLRVMLGRDAVEKTRGKVEALRGDWGRAEGCGMACGFEERG